MRTPRSRVQNSLTPRQVFCIIHRLLNKRAKADALSVLAALSKARGDWGIWWYAEDGVSALSGWLAEPELSGVESGDGRCRG